VDKADELEQIIQDTFTFDYSCAGVGKEYVALLPGGKIRRVGVLGRMVNPLLGSLFMCLVESHSKPGYLYGSTVAPGTILAEYDAEVLELLRGGFRAAQATFLQSTPDSYVANVDLTGNWLQPATAASC
jgi:hypothetical protein